MFCLNGQIDPFGKSPGQRIEWRQYHGQSYPVTIPSQPGSSWQQLQPIADEISHHVHRPYKLALGLGQSWMQQQIAPSKEVKRIAKLLKADIGVPQVWIFDRLAHSVTCQDHQMTKTYWLNQVVDVEVTVEGTQTPKTDSDGDEYYDVTGQVQLVLSSGQRLPIQQLYHCEYHWKPNAAKPSMAQVWAEEIAQAVRQFIH